MKDVVVLMGDGIGPEIIQGTIDVINSFNLPINWHFELAGIKALESQGILIPKETIDAIHRYKVVLKGPMTTPIGKGFRSVNVQMRKLFNLSSNIRPASTDIKLHKRYEPFRIVVFRENTEGLYGGREFLKEDGTAVAEKVVSVEKSRDITKAACDFAIKNGFTKITIGHKANILKVADGLFLDQALDVIKGYPTLTAEPLIIDNLCAKLVSRPENFEIIVTTNLYGDILSDLLGGMVGSIGVLPSINIGDEIAFFEPVHGSAPDIAGLSMANPVGAILSGALLLKHIGYDQEGRQLEQTVYDVINKLDIKTRDIGGCLGTSEFTEALMEKLRGSDKWGGDYGKFNAVTEIDRISSAK
jgi:isocitrate dehydrogenase (NAD+)